jgi:hypothetical protein
MARRPPSPDDDNPPASADDAPGATAFVRVEDVKPAPSKIPPLRSVPEPVMGAPKKGLQVTLPDDEPPPPPPKPKPVPASAKAKGRRGAWWDQKSDKLGDDEEVTQGAAPEPEPEPEPAGDDAPGATAFLQAPPPPPPKKKRAPPKAEPAPADDGRTQFYKPEAVVLQAEARQRPAPVAPPEPGLPIKLILQILGIFLLVTVLSVMVVYRNAFFGPSKSKPKASPSRVIDPEKE